MDVHWLPWGILRPQWMIVVVPQFSRYSWLAGVKPSLFETLVTFEHDVSLFLDDSRARLGLI
jgi:hypothetical protein